MYGHCGEWIHSRCAGVKKVTPNFSSHFACGKFEGNIGKVVEQEENLYGEVETVREFTCLDERVSVSGGCEAAVTVRTRCQWDMFNECGELMYGRRFSLRLKGAGCKSYVRAAILY